MITPAQATEPYDPEQSACTDLETIVVEKRRTVPVQVWKADTPLPAHSDHACWWCVHRFVGKPFFMPVKYIERLRTYYVQGNFCSPNCVRAYMNKDYSAFREIHLGWLTDILRGCYGIDPFDRANPLRPAPPRERLQLLGGDLTIDQFRALSNERMCIKLPITRMPEEKIQLLSQPLLIEETFITREQRPRQIPAVPVPLAASRHLGSRYQGVPFQLNIVRTRHNPNAIDRFMRAK